MNREVVQGPWGGGNHLVRAICEEGEKNGFRVVHKFEPNLDAILMIDPRLDRTGIDLSHIWNYKQANPNTKVVHRVNECDKRKGTTGMDDLLRSASSIADLTIFVSNWLRAGFVISKKGWTCANQAVVYNGVNHDHFKPNEKIDNGKTNIIAHHWSNNPMKGFDIYDAIDEWVGTDENFTFTYIGRERGTFKNTKVIPPLFGEELGKELGRYDIYISGSRFDPGPNHIIEAMACGLPTFAHRNGGGAVEFVGLAGVDYTFGSTEELISHLLMHHQQGRLPCEVRWEISWEESAKQYFDLIHKVCDGQG